MQPSETGCPPSRTDWPPLAIGGSTVGPRPGSNAHDVGCVQHEGGTLWESAWQPTEGGGQELERGVPPFRTTPPLSGMTPTSLWNDPHQFLGRSYSLIPRDLFPPCAPLAANGAPPVMNRGSPRDEPGTPCDGSWIPSRRIGPHAWRTVRSVVTGVHPRSRTGAPFPRGRHPCISTATARWRPVAAQFRGRSGAGQHVAALRSTRAAAQRVLRTATGDQLSFGPFVLDTIARRSRRALPATTAVRSPATKRTAFVTVGLFEDGTPGEIFLVMAKEASDD